MTAITATAQRHANRLGVLWAVVAACWLLIVAADATGEGSLLHHHALIEGGPPLPLALGMFSVGWLLMVAAMMVPASMSAFELFAPVRHFLSAYFVVWLVAGIAFFAGDVVLHRIVDATPWLAARPWLIEAGVVALAGAYQFTSLKRRSLDACRHPQGVGHTDGGAINSGVAHAVDCLGASGPLMLLMFAAGFANIVWMVALAALMTYEARGTRGHLAVRASGLVLLYLALFALTNQGLPVWPVA